MYTILYMYVCIVQGDQIAQKLVQAQESLLLPHIWSILLLAELYIMVII